MNIITVIMILVLLFTTGVLIKDIMLKRDEIAELKSYIENQRTVLQQKDRKLVKIENDLRQVQRLFNSQQELLESRGRELFAMKDRLGETE